LSNFSKAAAKAQENTLRKIEQRRFNAGVEPFAPVGTAPAVAATSAAPPKANEIITAPDGKKYRFKGGNPNDKANYQEVK